MPLVFDRNQSPPHPASARLLPPPAARRRHHSDQPGMEAASYADDLHSTVLWWSISTAISIDFDVESIAAVWTARRHPFWNKHPQSQPWGSLRRHITPACPRPLRLGSGNPSQQAPLLLLNTVTWTPRHPARNRTPQHRPQGPLQRYRCDRCQPPGAGAAVFLEGVPVGVARGEGLLVGFERRGLVDEEVSR
ncbi:ABC transporter [Striga asiatica]|uniref:ABC transporter n=1 Tax=Striga asiatica TaxID=4170 RepID=A0A5A7R4U3_STRAF|nr:ABC transporter [Striga asiatica]